MIANKISYMGKMKDLISNFTFASGKVISIDLGSRSIRVVALMKKGGRASVLSCDEVDRSEEDFAGDLNKLLDKNDIYRGCGVIVTDQVRFLASELNMPGGKNLSENKLTTAAAWEMEPYLDFPVGEGIFVCQLQELKAGEDATPILISAIEKKSYLQFSEILKKRRVMLHRAYSPEWAAAFYSESPPEGRGKIIIDCREENIRGVFVTARGPAVFQTLPLSPDASVVELIRQMINDLIVVSGEAEEIVIAGITVPRESIHEFRGEFENIRLWGVEDVGEVDLAPEVLDFGPQYAAAVSAACQELRLIGKLPLAVTDRVPVIELVLKKVRENERLIPAFVLGLFFIFMVIHYISTNISISRYSAKIKTIKSEKKGLMAPIEEKNRLTDKLAETQKKKKYLEITLAARNKKLVEVLSGVLRLIPSDVVLNRLQMRKDGSYYIEGNAYKGRSVASFTHELSKLKSCETINLLTLSRKGGDMRSKILPYHFGINITLNQLPD